MEKLLPQNTEAESGVLGSILIDPEAIVQVADFLLPEDFYRDANRTIYDTILQLYETREPADFITVCDELERKDKLDEVGGPGYISSLINQVPTSGNVEYYGRIVERTAILRRLIHASGQIAAVAYEEVDATVALDTAEKLIFAISQRHARADFSPLRDLLTDYMERLDKLHENRGSLVGIPTGFTDLDRLTGGLQRSDLIILAARPAVGKCMAAWTLIDDPASGARLTIAECVRRRLPTVHSLSSQGQIHVAAIGDWIDSGIQPCYRVTTRSGRAVDVTGHHPFLGTDGWTPLHELHPGRPIAVPAAVPAFGSDESWPLAQVRLLASTLAAGTISAPLTRSGDADPVLVQEAAREAQAQGHAFPADVWRWSRRYLAQFLHTLLGCDRTDSASGDDSTGITFRIASQQLASDVFHALIRFGIRAGFSQVSNQIWQIAITHSESVKKYQSEIGLLPGEATDRSADLDLYWDEIASIEPIGEHQVYDLTVPDGANFVAQDVFVHNTSLGLSLAHNAAIKYSHSIAIFSLEMSKDQLVQRLLSMDAGIDQQRLRTGWIEDDEWDRIVFAMNTLSEANIWIDDTAGISTMEMRSKARRLQAEHGIDLIIVDYLQLMQSSAGGKRNENRVQEISEISRNLKGLARELNVPVMALAQLSRAVESRQSKVPQLSDLRESGCLTGETLIYLPDLGEYRRIDALIGKHGFNVLALNTQTWKLEPKPVIKAFSTGRKPVFKMTTRSGRIIRATANHKFLAFNGWKSLAEITAGTHIALPRTLPGPSSLTMTFEELALLGHLIGDGCVLPRHAVQYTTIDEDLAESVVQLATQVFGDRVLPRIRWEQPKTGLGGWYQVYLPSSSRLTHEIHNPIVAWLNEMGVHGLRSYEKYVPACVFAQPTEGVACFLRHLWSTDGCASYTTGRAIPTVYYATSSTRLANDVQSLLMRLEINSRIKRVSQGNKGRDQYHVYLSGKPDLDQFITLVGIAGERKQEILERIRVHIAEYTANTNRDIIPNLAWRQLVVPAMIASGLTTRQMQSGIGMAYCGTRLYKQGIGRERALRVATIVQSPELLSLAQSDIYWDTVISIEDDGEEEVYDLTVSELHNFVANNIVVHNSIEQDADVVMFIYREDVYNPETERKNIADIIVAKHRNGPVGEISLYFQASQTRFTDLEVSPPVEE